MDTRHIRRSPPKQVNLYKLSAKQLHSHLMREPLPTELTEETKQEFQRLGIPVPESLEAYREHIMDKRLALRDKILADKNAQRADKIKRTHHAKLWRDLMSPLKYELTNARVGARYKSTHPTPERDIAFTAYIKLLEKALMKIEGYQVHGLTPSQLAQESDIPNNGSHWTDWMPTQKKREITALFEAIPMMPRTKRKLPFQRTQRPDAPNRGLTKLNRLKQRTLKELEMVQREYAVAPTDKRKETLRKMKQALAWMDDMTPSEFVPPTCHGLYPKDSD
jgi:hypothetical protein